VRTLRLLPSPPRRRAPDFRSSTRWKKVRLRILARDLWTCTWCGNEANEADHVLPVSQGGAPYDEANLVAACGPCNRARMNPTWVPPLQREVGSIEGVERGASTLHVAPMQRALVLGTLRFFSRRPAQPCRLVPLPPRSTPPDYTGPPQTAQEPVRTAVRAGRTFGGGGARAGASDSGAFPHLTGDYTAPPRDSDAG